MFPPLSPTEVFPVDAWRREQPGHKESQNYNNTNRIPVTEPKPPKVTSSPNISSINKGVGRNEAQGLACLKSRGRGNETGLMVSHTGTEATRTAWHNKKLIMCRSPFSFFTQSNYNAQGNSSWGLPTEETAAFPSRREHHQQWMKHQ